MQSIRQSVNSRDTLQKVAVGFTLLGQLQQQQQQNLYRALIMEVHGGTCNP